MQSGEGVDIGLKRRTLPGRAWDILPHRWHFAPSLPVAILPPCRPPLSPSTPDQYRRWPVNRSCRRGIASWKLSSHPKINKTDNFRFLH